MNFAVSQIGLYSVLKEKIQNGIKEIFWKILKVVDARHSEKFQFAIEISLFVYFLKGKQFVFTSHNMRSYFHVSSRHSDLTTPFSTHQVIFSDSPSRRVEKEKLGITLLKKSDIEMSIGTVTSCSPNFTEISMIQSNG